MLKKKKPAAAAAPPSTSSPFRLDVGHFAFVQTPKKTHILSVTQAAEGAYEGVVASSLDGEHFAFEESDVLAVLPVDFAPGATAFGLPVEVIRNVETGPLGPIAFFISMTTKERKALTSAAFDVVEWLKTRNLLPEKDIAISVHAPKGKWAGSYKRLRKDTQPDELKIHSSLPISAYPYIFGHEAGHCVWHHKVSPAHKAAWIKLYTDSIDVTHSTEKELAECFDALKSVDGDLKAAAAECGNKPLFSEILKWIKKTYRVRAITLSALAKSGEWDRVESLWPTDPIALGTPEELLTEYGKVAPEELFAEAFAEFYQGHQMPPKLDKLMRATLASAEQHPSPETARKTRGTGEVGLPGKKKKRFPRKAGVS